MPNVTLIGDAAHVMPPYAGEGVNMAAMFARMQHMTAETMANTEMFYAPDALDRFVALFRGFGGTQGVQTAAEARGTPRVLGT